MEKVMNAKTVATVRERERERELYSREIAFVSVEKIDNKKIGMDYQVRDGPSFLC